ncbi:MAG: Ubiquinone biosynthesis O-methyltransferase [Chlamydiae bacterium]|nr:Ubiquinone biosynthesis O-methyltransferase [Chlamydiota bacterium]
MNHTWDNHWSFNFRNDPKRLGFVLARYKFCSKMAPDQARILELGCSSGIGVPLLSKKAKSYVGVDLDFQALESAKDNFKHSGLTFLYEDFMGKTFGQFDVVVSLDVVEHILPQYEETYFETVIKNLDSDGICMIGTPNETSSPYASEYSKLGHVNLFSQQRLAAAIKKYFHQAFSFGLNDEIVHTGYAPMAHYLLCVGCHKK